MRFAICDGQIVDAHELASAEDVNNERKRKFECMGCAEKHAVCFKKTKHERYYVPGFFQHTDNLGGNSSGGGGAGGSGGESETHAHAKYLLQKHVGRYSFKLAKCTKCKSKSKMFWQGSVSVEHRDDQSSYIYDAVLHSDDHAPVVMEVWHKHETEEAKRQHVLRRGWFFAEFDADDIIESLEDSKDKVYLQNIKAQSLVCRICLDHEKRMREIEEKQAADNRLTKFYEESCFDTWNFAHEQWSVFENIVLEKGYYHQYALWLEEVAFQKHRSLQAIGFAKARDRVEELEQMKIDVHNPRPRIGYEYKKGDFKCFLCKKWRSKNEHNSVCGSNWSLEEFKRITQWNKVRFHTEKKISCCDICVIQCQCCKNNQPLTSALKFGLCLRCNILRGYF